MKPDEILNTEKIWTFPRPKDNSFSADIKVTQQMFYDQYHPSGHLIYSTAWYNDIPMYGKDKKLKGYHSVKRVSLPIQKDSITVVLAHLLGNSTQFKDSTVGKNKGDIMAQYKECWDLKNMDDARFQFVKSALAVGDSAILFYRNTESTTLDWKVFSFLDGDDIRAINDKYGNLAYFARFYSFIEEDGSESQRCDITDKEKCITYKKSATSDWDIVEGGLHGFNTIPVVYHKRPEGAFWTHVQSDIDDLEMMVSRVSEDNKYKSKSRYHLKTDSPNAVQLTSSGNSDLVITDSQGDFKMVAGAEISTQFKFEYDVLTETVFNSLGMVYPKSKSSGDMPTGTMKMMFYPTERVVFELIKEFNKHIDLINKLFKNGITYEKPELLKDLPTLNVSAYIKMFTPQDETAWNTMLGQSKAQGILSTQTATENCTVSSNDEYARIKAESAELDAKTQLDTQTI